MWVFLQLPVVSHDGWGHGLSGALCISHWISIKSTHWNLTVCSLKSSPQGLTGYYLAALWCVVHHICGWLSWQLPLPWVPRMLRCAGHCCTSCRSVGVTLPDLIPLDSHCSVLCHYFSSSNLLLMLVRTGLSICALAICPPVRPGLASLFPSEQESIPLSP